VKKTQKQTKKTKKYKLFISYLQFVKKKKNLFTWDEECDQMKVRKSINLNDPFHNLRQNLQILLQNHKKQIKIGL